MTEFTLHDLSTSPNAARADLEAVEKKYGFIPNLMAIMAEAPPLLKGYLALSQLLEQTTLSAQERNLLLLAISVANGCDYCVAAHTLSSKGAKLPADVIEAVRNDRPISNSRLKALRALAQSVANDRGRPAEETVREFYDSGYTKANLLEVILAVGMKTLSNYTNHVADTPLDSAFRTAAWQKGD